MTGSMHGPLSANTRGALLMMLAMLAFVLNDACMKLLADELPLFQAIFLRGLAVGAVFLPLAWRLGALRLPDLPRDRRLLLWRSAAEVAAAWLFLSALFNMPLANATAILQSLPLAMTVAGALVLGERVGPLRWSAVAVGFLGVLLIVQPGADGFNVYSLHALGSVAAVTLRDVVTRQMSPALPSLTVASATALTVTLAFGLLALVPGLSGAWVRPSAQGWGLLALAAAFLVAGYLLAVMMMRAGEVSFIAPFRYTGLLWALLLGVLLWGDWPDLLTLMGAALVVAAGSFALWRGARRGAAASHPPADPSR